MNALSDGGEDDDDQLEPPETLWTMLRAALEEGKSEITEIGRVLHAICQGLQKDISALDPSNKAESALDLNKPHVKQTLVNLDGLTEVLKLVPDPRAAQYSRDAPQVRTQQA